MKKQSKVLILVLVFCSALVLGSGAYAASRTKNLEVTYNDIKLVVDGVPITPKDANGTVVEPFICDGTTYLPVRAIGEAIGKTVRWDGNTKTVYIGGVPGEPIYLLDVCPPYETVHYNVGIATMAGTKYLYSMSMGYYGFMGIGAEKGLALFNLNGQYSKMSFDAGHLDGGEMVSATYYIYLDGKLVSEIELDPELPPKHYELDLNGALQMKIEATGGGHSFALGNITVERMD